jgi:hypothetical protein
MEGMEENIKGKLATFRNDFSVYMTNRLDQLMQHP